MIISVWFSFFFGNWAPDQAESLQLRVDPASLTSGSGAPLVVPNEACGQQSECADAYGVGSSCQGDVCDVLYFDCDRSDSVCSLFSMIVGASQVSLTGGWGPIPGSPPLVDPGFSVYTGTLVLEVPVGAAGTYTLDVTRDQTTFCDSSISVNGF